MLQALEVPHRRKPPLTRLARTPDAPEDPLGADTRIDRTRLFVPPSLTPLYYTGIYHELNPIHRLRYNQLMGMLQNEVIAYFETAFASNVLGALARDDANPELDACLRNFITEEARHTAVWRKLNRLSEPDWYASADHRLLGMPRPVSLLLDALSRWPRWFPMILWVMLIMEEHSLEISRRYAQMDDAEIEPHYSAVYRWHLEDEVRHVQIDWHLIERVYAGCPTVLRRSNAALLTRFVDGFFRAPGRSSEQVIAKLVGEFPELKPFLPRLRCELAGLATNLDYGRMMFSDAVNPITFGLFEHFPEFYGLREAMRTGLAVES